MRQIARKMEQKALVFCARRKVSWRATHFEYEKVEEKLNASVFWKDTGNCESMIVKRTILLGYARHTWLNGKRYG